MKNDKIKIAAFGSDDHEYAKVFEGETAIIDALNYFLSTMDRNTFENARLQIAYVAEHAMKVGAMKYGTQPTFEEWKAAR